MSRSFFAAPHWASPYYTSPYYGAAGVAPPSVAGVRDRLILAAMANAIRATQQFDVVVTSGLNELAANMTADQTRVCAMELTGKPTENQLWSNATTVSLERIVPMTATIIVRHEDADERDDESDRLFNVAANAIAAGNPFLGVTMPRKSRLISGNWIDAKPPERRYRADGQFVYVVNSPTTRNETP